MTTPYKFTQNDDFVFDYSMNVDDINDDINDELDFPPPPKLSRSLDCSTIIYGIIESASTMKKVCVYKLCSGWVYIIEPIQLNYDIYYKYSCYSIHDDPFKYNTRTLFNILFNTENEYEEFYTINYNSKKIQKILDYKLTDMLNKFLKKAQNKADNHNFMDMVVCN